MFKINSTAMREEESIDHQRVWKRLREEIHNLIDKGVLQLAPEIVLAYMDFLEEVERGRNAD